MVETILLVFIVLMRFRDAPEPPFQPSKLCLDLLDSQLSHLQPILIIHLVVLIDL